MQVSETALEAPVRRAAKCVGLIARKSRWRSGSFDNQGGFQLVNKRNIPVGGARYDLAAEEVLDFCRPE